MPYKPAQIESMLKTKLGMYKENKDHRWFRVDFNGLPPIRTKISHNNKEVGASLENRISKQLRIRNKFFHELMDCTKYKPEYEAQIRQDPIPPFSQIIV